MTKKDNFRSILLKLEELHKLHPTYSYGHIHSLAFSDYNDTFNLSDKECLFALDKYECELELDGDMITSPDYIAKLYKDVENFDSILDEEEED